MKIYIVLVLVAITSASEEWKHKTLDEWHEIEEKCKQEHKISPEIEVKVNTEKYIPKEAFELSLCFLRGVGLWTDSKGFSVDGLMYLVESVPTVETLNIDSLRDQLKKCIDIDSNSKGDTPLDRAYSCYKCFRDNEDLYKTLRKAKLYEEPKHLDK
ncbi:uncharacterized protein LOC129915892 [Episyrphus balteatus]|uniref:uncharacterized protein LOC129915892 n=1 Tax=Episyrphus balteatus TaxID=286459 RepID=UPI0024859414|nr:uncharacterized protein LOC129915892 [Episyrphus balteatus]